MKHTLPQLLFFIFFITAPLTAFAQGPPGSESGFSGRFQAGAFFLQTDSQISTEDSNRHTDDLYGPADTHDFISALASAYLRYQFENGTAVYTGNPLEVGEGFALAAGVSKPMTAGTLDVAATWLPIKAAWKNPYQTVTARDQTDVDTYGLRFQLQEIGRSPWEVNYSINRIDIKDDVIGDLEGDLKRSGLIHDLGVKYTLAMQPGISLSPQLNYIYGNIDGRSNSYQGIKLGMMLKRIRPPWVFIGLVSGSYDHYQKTHPLFGKTRHESGISTFAQVMRLNLFGTKRLFASAGAGYVWSDANIDFFDSQTVIGLASIGINF